MTRQEIKEAIENGDTIWVVDRELDRLIPYVNGYICVNGINVKKGGYGLRDLYKTKAEAEHYLHHANVERVEKLPFLTWEEFKGGEEVIFKGRNGKGYALVYNKGLDKIDLFDTDGIMWGIIESWDLTEENFYKAYDECVRLFKGEE